mmetsp:Transcript_3797/g.7652  ORF Transcript_3797/g.7652 Transcript_3797/m.7652 type:complete len:159 (-) Transcript_3797:267-743(-)
MSPPAGAASRQSRAASPPPRDATVGKASSDGEACKENVQANSKANSKADGAKEAAKLKQNDAAAQSPSRTSSIKSRLAALPPRRTALALAAAVLVPVLAVVLAVSAPRLSSTMVHDGAASVTVASVAAAAALVLGGAGLLIKKRLAKRSAAKANGKAA